MVKPKYIWLWLPMLNTVERIQVGMDSHQGFKVCPFGKLLIVSVVPSPYNMRTLGSMYGVVQAVIWTHCLNPCMWQTFYNYGKAILCNAKNEINFIMIAIGKLKSPCSCIM